MPWDYSFNNFNNNNFNSSFGTNSLGTAYSPNKTTFINFSTQFDKNPSISSFSSDSISSVNNMGIEEEIKLLPQNLWGETLKNSNTFEESLFFQKQLQNTEQLWCQKPLEQSQQMIPQASQVLQHSLSSQSIFDMKFNGLNQSNQQMNNNYTASTTPPILQLNPSSPNAFNSFQPLNNLNIQNSNDFIGNNQSLLQNYQLQQQCAEQPQELQEVQQQLLQNPLLLQQNAQLASQQLQQLQLQVQVQKQQLESTNQLLNKKVELNEKLPLTQENLIKLQQPQAKELSSSSESNSNGEKTTLNVELYKTELCATFQRTGYCPYSTKCQFAHGENELKHIERGSKWRSKPCTNWSKTGSCRYGNRCCFKHDD